MKQSPGVVSMLEDLGKEFAAGTGSVLTGLSLRQTVTGWQMIVKRMNKEREKQVLFVDAWTVNELLEALYRIVYDGEMKELWKPDKF